MSRLIVACLYAIAIGGCIVGPAVASCAPPEQVDFFAWNSERHLAKVVESNFALQGNDNNRVNVASARIPDRLAPLHSTRALVDPQIRDTVASGDALGIGIAVGMGIGLIVAIVLAVSMTPESSEE